MRPKESFVSQPVRSLQTMLRVLAEDDNELSSLVPDGIYGNQTRQAVSTFQRKYGIPMTGVVNEET
jgi:peptidoglycan hydrolase-like protein with peptidoglycan-binding domain